MLPVGPTLIFSLAEETNTSENNVQMKASAGPSCIRESNINHTEEDLDETPC